MPEIKLGEADCFLDKSINCLVYKSLENNEKCPSQSSNIQNLKRFSLLWYKQKKAANPHIGETATRDFHWFTHESVGWHRPTWTWICLLLTSVFVLTVSELWELSTLCLHCHQHILFSASSAYKTVSGVNGPLVILDQVKVRTSADLRWPTSGFMLSFSELRSTEFKFGLRFSSSFFFKALSSHERKSNNFFFYEFRWLQKVAAHHFNHVQALNMSWLYVQHVCILMFISTDRSSLH